MVSFEVHTHTHTHTHTHLRLKTDKHKVKLQLIASIVEKCQQHLCNPAAILERIILDTAAGTNNLLLTANTHTDTHTHFQPL